MGEALKSQVNWIMSNVQTPISKNSSITVGLILGIASLFLTLLFAILGVYSSLNSQIAELNSQNAAIETLIERHVIDEISEIKEDQKEQEKRILKLEQE